ncbi:cofactor of BRCA1-domain-containing protein [Gigaspora rosea]|uniref:Cofactor of BRCA1-domain-containing protein n=1 Tax=Gigaspora rosea TaxID=44941 RepID=A0A397V9R7_9GLOM|nr:cofactor of BRCA1-domain-containing protein [Gigaspora rosea]
MSSFDPDHYMLGNAGARRLGLLLGQTDPVTGITEIQQRYQVKVENIENVYPLLELSGTSRFNIHVGILEALRNKFIQAIETENWDHEKFTKFLSKSMGYLFIKEFRPVVLALLKKYPDRVTKDIYEMLAQEPNIIHEAPIEIKRGLYERNKKMFKVSIQAQIVSYFKDQTLGMQAREMRGISVNDVLDRRINAPGLQYIINLVHENAVLFAELQNIVREWYKEYGLSKLCSFRFDFFMGMQKAGRIHMCKQDHSYNIIWYINGGIRKGLDEKAITSINAYLARYKKTSSREFSDVAMIFQDPIVYNVFSARIVESLKKYISESYKKHTDKTIEEKNKTITTAAATLSKEKESTVKWLSLMVTFGSYAHKMLISKNFNMPQVDEEIYNVFYKKLLFLMYDDKVRELKTRQAMAAHFTADDEQDVPNTANPALIFGEVELRILKRNDLARKVFCHYMLDRCEKGDIIALRRALNYFRVTMPANDSDILHVEVYETMFQSLITLLIKHHRIRILFSEKWRGVIKMLITTPWKVTIHEMVIKLLIEFYNEDVSETLENLGTVEKLKQVREWSEIAASHYTQFGIKRTDRTKIYYCYNLLVKKSNQCLNGLWSIKQEICPTVWDLGIEHGSATSHEDSHTVPMEF